MNATHMAGEMSPKLLKVTERANMTWKRYRALLQTYPLPQPRIRVRVWGHP